MIDLGRNCSRHRAPLVDFVDRGEVGPGTAAALAHLDRCARCTDAIEATMLTITALRRLGGEAAAVEPPADAWPRLRLRIERWRRPSRFMSPVAGLAVSTAMVVVLVVPLRLGGSLARPGASPTAIGGPPVNAADRRIEAAYISAVRRPGVGRTEGSAVTAAWVVAYPRANPDNYRQTRKEVGPAEPSGRPPEAI